MMRWAMVTALVLTAPAAAATLDPAGDFLTTYTGPQLGALDFKSVDARFDGSAFHLTATVNGSIPATPNMLFVWGIDRGAGTPRLNFLFDPDLDPSVRWDSLAVQFTDGTLRTVAFPPAGAPAITTLPGGVTILGNTLRTTVPLAALPGRGFAARDYRFQIWSRYRTDPAVDGPNTEIADFGPRITAAIPEPATWAMMTLGFGAAGAALRRRARMTCYRRMT